MLSTSSRLSRDNQRSSWGSVDFAAKSAVGFADNFNEAAGLQPGEAQTVVLSVQVLADGSVGQMSVISSSGNLAVDEEALLPPLPAMGPG